MQIGVDLKVVEVGFEVVSDCCDLAVGIESGQLVGLSVEGKDRLGVVVKDVESLHDGLFAVVGSAACLAPLQQSPLQFLQSTVEVNN